MCYYILIYHIFSKPQRKGVKIMSTVNRTLNNLYHNPDMVKFFHSFRNLETNSPIPNQALPIAFNKEGQESHLFL